MPAAIRAWFWGPVGPERRGEHADLPPDTQVVPFAHWGEDPNRMAKVTLAEAQRSGGAHPWWVLLPETWAYVARIEPPSMPGAAS